MAPAPVAPALAAPCTGGLLAAPCTGGSCTRGTLHWWHPALVASALVASCTLGILYWWQHPARRARALPQPRRRLPPALRDPCRLRAPQPLERRGGCVWRGARAAVLRYLAAGGPGRSHRREAARRRRELASLAQRAADARCQYDLPVRRGPCGMSLRSTRRPQHTHTAARAHCERRRSQQAQTAAGAHCSTYTLQHVQLQQARTAASATAAGAHFTPPTHTAARTHCKRRVLQQARTSHRKKRTLQQVRTAAGAHREGHTLHTAGAHTA